MNDFDSASRAAALALAMPMFLCACGGGGGQDAPAAPEGRSIQRQSIDPKRLSGGVPGVLKEGTLLHVVTTPLAGNAWLRAAVDYTTGSLLGEIELADGAPAGAPCNDPNWHVVLSFRGSQVASGTATMQRETFDGMHTCIVDFTLTGASMSMPVPDGSPMAGDWMFNVQSLSGPSLAGSLFVSVDACRSQKNPPLPVYHAQLAMPGARDSVYTTRGDVYADLTARGGYWGGGQQFRVESHPGWWPALSQAEPYLRYWYAPWSDHINVSRQEDIAILNSVGFQFEAQEGYVYKTQVPNTVPLYRFWLNHGGEDVEHLTTADPAMADSLRAIGWNSDGVVGFVCRP